MINLLSLSKDMYLFEFEYILMFPFIILNEQNISNWRSWFYWFASYLNTY